MKKKFLLSAFLTLCSLGMWSQATYPEHMYLIGDATTAGWNLDYAIVMTTESDGVYTWEGSLTEEGNLKFLEGADWLPSYGPSNNGQWLQNNAFTLVKRTSYNEEEEAGIDRQFYVNTTGTYRLRLDLTGAEPKLIVGYRSMSAAALYFKNTGNAWSNVYLRIGRADHVYAKAFTRIADTEWWYCQAPDYDGYSMFTITDSSDETTPIDSYPDGANRLYEWTYDLTANRWFTLTDGPHASGEHFYWNNSSSESTQASCITESAGYRIYFDNSLTQWTQPYMRIGRTHVTGMGDYASSYAMTQVTGTDIWYVETVDWSNAEAWTITSSNANTGDQSVYSLPAEAERIYWYTDNIASNKWVVPSGSRQGSGPYWWANEVTEVDIYTRTLTDGKYGTICLNKASKLIIGATLYRIADADDAGLTIEEVTEMTAGTPYILLASGNELTVLTAGDEETAQTVNGLVGYIGVGNLTVPISTNNYILHDNKLYQVDQTAYIAPNHAYIDRSGITAVTPAPGMRRYALPIHQNPQTPTAIDEVNNLKMEGKHIVNGELVIYHDGKMYNATGRMLQ